MTSIEHVAIWVRQIDSVSTFYARWFSADIGELYINDAKGFRSRFLAFPSGARLEVMSGTDIRDAEDRACFGYAHIALCVGDEQAVDELAERMRHAGVRCIDGPRRTGDGYYEAVVADPEGNRVEIMAERQLQT